MLSALLGAGASLLGSYFTQRNANRNVDLQREFASHGVERKVEDARRAGVSPLFALGAPTHSFSPVGVGGDGGLQSAGQNISRAMAAQASPQGRAGTLAVDLAAAQLEGVKLDNQAKQQDILAKSNLVNQPGTPPAILDNATTRVIDGQPVGVELKKEMQPAGYIPQKSFGVSPEIDMWKTKHGYAPEVPQELGEAHESQPLAAAQWFMRNKMLPWYGSENTSTYPYPAPSGSYWTFDPMFGQYILVNKKGDPPHEHYKRDWNNLMNRMRSRGRSTGHGFY